jgi:hypothetical protein
VDRNEDGSIDAVATDTDGDGTLDTVHYSDGASDPDDPTLNPFAR